MRVGVAACLIAAAPLVCGCASVGFPGEGEVREDAAAGEDREEESPFLADALTVTFGNVLWLPYRVVGGTLSQEAQVLASYGGMDEGKQWLAAPVTLPLFLAIEAVAAPLDMVTREPVVHGSWRSLRDHLDQPFEKGVKFPGH